MTRADRWADRALPAAALVSIVAAWQLSGLFLNPILISTPTAVAAELVDLGRNGQIWLALGASLEEMVIGMAVGLTVGIGLGVLMGRYTIVARVLFPYVNFFNATPLVVIIPLVIIWVGITTQARLLFVFLITLWPVLLNTAAGIRNVDRGYLDVGVAFGLGERDVLRKISLPAATPFILAGVRISAGLAIIGMIVSEMEISFVGLGFLLVSFGNSFETAKLLAVVIVTSLLGVLNVTILKAVQSRWFPWIGGVAGAGH
ncbi:MAG TPA: ABC transporter permease [Candidatus Limnocylindria bacterium]|nr:ABC transporter permease [Candidatus Limnocylindria bacterium]